MVTGTHPCMSEMCCRNGQMGSARIVVATSPVRDAGEGVTPTIVAKLSAMLLWIGPDTGSYAGVDLQISAAWPVGTVTFRGYSDP